MATPTEAPLTGLHRRLMIHFHQANVTIQFRLARRGQDENCKRLFADLSLLLQNI